jgi:2-polyprenyl-3-methyl-5-hydroxy-6-metoxy-1,4-benzoquinol methylase
LAGFFVIVLDMDFIRKLFSIDLLSGGTALDLGAGQLEESKKLVEAGYEVDAIDIQQPEHIPEGVNFSLSHIKDYKFEKNYNLVLAQNVLFFLKNPLGVLQKLIDSTEANGLICFTLLGERDAWNDREGITCFSREDIEKYLSSTNTEIIFKQEEEGLGLSVADEIKYWHVYWYIIRKK